ncbi:hypothetical protein [Nocardia sp. alder85J]|uniref:hypothetical protein n=1 Tax=Nocardia sp. alder85J TaxID=2862949 RepID=UPI001CD4E6DF|nr:hypothetical protein [Nocardia sp. alder85J]MCX4095123.1 hypothetical protein [Nocardia sp. alder85J]
MEEVQAALTEGLQRIRTAVQSGTEAASEETGAVAGGIRSAATNAERAEKSALGGNHEWSTPGSGQAATPAARFESAPESAETASSATLSTAQSTVVDPVPSYPAAIYPAVPETFVSGIPDYQLDDALTNLSGGSAQRLSRFGPGAGFSGVYNPETGQFLAYPSGNTRYHDGRGFPMNLVARLGGHGEVNDTFTAITGLPARDSVGFVAVIRDDGGMGCRWSSSSVNNQNPSFAGREVPERLRPGIMDGLEQFTGRRVESDT